jgi:hypothetical protein
MANPPLWTKSSPKKKWMDAHVQQKIPLAADVSQTSAG